MGEKLSTILRFGENLLWMFRFNVPKTEYFGLGLGDLFTALRSNELALLLIFCWFASDDRLLFRGRVNMDRILIFFFRKLHDLLSVCSISLLMCLYYPLVFHGIFRRKLKLGTIF